MRSLLWLLLSVLASAPVHAQSEDGNEPLDELAQYAVGRRHTCAVTTAGAAWCWGGSPEGQIGDGGFDDRVSPVPVSGLGSGVQAIAPGDKHTCALMAGGTVKCWGSNQAGALGVGAGPGLSSTSFVPTPIDVPSLSNIRQISSAAIGRRTCAVNTSNQVFCWGAQFGPTGGTAITPVQISDAGGGFLSAVERVSVGNGVACALITGGTVKCWGNNFNGELGVDPALLSRRATADVIPGLAGLTATDLALGTSSVCVALSNGEVRCWGDNNSGQLGNGLTSTTPRFTPQVVQGLGAVASADRLVPGWQHHCLQKANNALFCWGTNTSGEFGNGTIASSTTAVAGLAGRTDLSGAVGSFQHSCARDGDGALLCWGRSDNGQLGTSATTDVLFPTRISLANAQTLGFGLNHSCATDSGGVARCWGQNLGGEIGNGTMVRQPLPQPVSGLEAGQVEFSGGFQFTCARSGSGVVRCWGGNDSGQLGLGTIDAGANAAQAPVTLGAAAISLAAGASHACAVLQGGAVKCWGDNGGGQLGPAGTLGTSAGTPIEVTGLPVAASKVAAGQAHSCALLVDGRVACWGDNGGEQLGVDFNTVNSPTPLLIPTISTATDLSSGPFHGCALLQDGGVRCWGDNFYGTLGSGLSNTTDPGYFSSPTPVSVVGLPGPASAISSSLSSTNCAVVEGLGYCWGWNLHGPLGDGSSRTRRSAVQVVLPGKSISRIETGGLHTCALTSDGEAYCWGWNIEGQVGNGNVSNSPNPERVIVDTVARMVSSVSDLGGSNGSEENNPVSDGSGENIVFTARDIPPGAKGGSGAQRLMRRNLRTGVVTPVSVDNAGNALPGDAIEATTSADGQLVVFVALKPLDGKAAKISGGWPKAGGSSPYGLFLRNISTNTTTALGNARLGGTGSKPQIAPGGGSVVYTRETEAGEGTAGSINVFSVPLLPIGGGQLAAGSTRCETCKTVAESGASTSTSSEGNSEAPVLSADGQWLAFQTSAPNLIPQANPCPNISSSVMLRNMSTGVTQRISAPASGGTCGSGGASKPAMDYSGQNIVFVSSQPLAGGDNNGGNDVYLFKPGTGVTQVSVAEQGSVFGEVTSATISGNGQTVAFASSATNLDAREADNNDSSDIYVQRLRDRRLGRLTKNPRGVQANQASAAPSLNYSGKAIAFDSTSGNLTDESVPDVAAVYRRANPLAAGYVFDAGFE